MKLSRAGGAQKCEDVAALLTQGGLCGEYAINELAAREAFGSQARLAQENIMPYGTLGSIVGLDPILVDEVPETAHHALNPGAGSGRVALRNTRAFKQQGCNSFAERTGVLRKESRPSFVATTSGSRWSGKL